MTHITRESTSLTIEWHGHALLAMGERGLFHVESGTLYIADLHLGKASYFRARGCPVPEDVTAHDLDRLSRMIGETGASRLAILGDLFHAPPVRDDGTVDALRAWREAHASLECFLIKGNHDRRVGWALDKSGIELINGRHRDGPFMLAHEPPGENEAIAPTLCGHLHPSVRLTGRGRTTMRAACFWLGDRTAVLPAFGRFTGTSAVRPKKSDQVVMTHDGRVSRVESSFFPTPA